MKSITSFKLIEGSYSGSSASPQDLIQEHGLARIAAKAISTGLTIDHYLESRFQPFYEGKGLDLASLAIAHPSSQKPNFEPLARTTFDAAFKLKPGDFELKDSDRGVRVDTKALGTASSPKRGEEDAPESRLEKNTKTMKLKLKFG